MGFELRVTLPRLHLDQSAPMRELGMRGALEVAKRGASRGLERAAEAASYYARLGDDLSDFQRFSVADAARDLSREGLSYNVGVLPRSGVKVRLEPGRVEVDVKG